MSVKRESINLLRLSELAKVNMFFLKQLCESTFLYHRIPLDLIFTYSKLYSKTMSRKMHIGQKIVLNFLDTTARPGL